MSESIKDRFLKEHELSLEDLEKVTGGSPDQNSDGTYNIYNGQKIIFDPTKFAYVVGTYLNATGNTVIYFHYYNINPNGEYRGEGDSYECLNELLLLMS